MKVHKILIFFVIILVSLFFLTITFPKEGIYIGKLKLRFPSLERILTRSSGIDVEGIAEIEETPFSARDTLLQTLQDSIFFYTTLAENQTGKFYLPDNDLSYFDDFFYYLQQSKESRKSIRILHYGDSQIELDRISFNLRKYFQAKFGGTGPGLLPAVQTIPTSTVYQRFSGDYTLYSAYGDGIRRRNGQYGLLCKCVEIYGENFFYATATSNKELPATMKQFSHIKLSFYDKKGNFSAKLTNKNKSFSEKIESDTIGLQTWEWQLDSSTTAITLTMKGNADIYGIFIDGNYGVSVDNIPLRGSGGTLFTQLNDSMLIHSFEQNNVKLIILQFGGNAIPAISSRQSLENYVRGLERQINYLKRMNPNGKILFIGPSDMAKRVEGELRSYPLLGELVDELKTMVTNNGAAFWDMYEVMGGENSMIAWYKNGLAGEDFVHFTPKGAHKIGEILTQSFDNLYQLYLSKKAILQVENAESF